MTVQHNGLPLPDSIEKDLQETINQIKKALEELNNGFIESAKCHLEYALTLTEGNDLT